MSGADYQTEKRAIWAFDGAYGCKFYTSIGECSRDLGIDAASISKCCQGIYNSSHGYTFKYHEEDFEIDELGDFRKHNVKNYKRKPRNNADINRKKLVAVDISTKKYRIYETFSELCAELLLDERNAFRCLRHERYYKSTGGYSLYYYNEVDFNGLEGEF